MCGKRSGVTHNIGDEEGGHDAEGKGYEKYDNNRKGENKERAPNDFGDTH